MSAAWLADPRLWAALLTLTALEIVLGIDNLVFIAVLTSRLPQRRQAAARRIGLALALLTRLALLGALAWIAGIAAPAFSIGGHLFSWRDFILAAGGVFLLYSGTREIHIQIESEEGGDQPGGSPGFAGTVARIMVLDIVFSLDSIITAIGMARELWVMATAVSLAVAVMILAAEPLARFINRRPSVKLLAFSFLLLIGTTLVADGFGFHLPRGYIYAAIGFSAGVEALNQLAAARRRRLARPSL